MVEEGSPESEYELVADVPTCDPARNILYPVTPTLSVLAVQDKEMVVDVVPVANRPVGTDGGVVSGAVCVVACTAAD